ncbi:hypothetical protein ACS0TY_016172 [Phlomoides rotata]
MASQNFEPIRFPNLKDKINYGKNPLLSALFLSCSFFLTLLFVFFMYICTHRRRPDTDGGGSPNAPPPRAAGLDSATINALPDFSYGTKQSAGECAICLSIFQEGDRVKVLPLCNHRFHSECVGKWLRTRSSCPMCRCGVIQLLVESPARLGVP